MLRVVAQRQLRVCAHAPRRNFVSTVLLSKSYEDKTVAELRSEAKKRGITSSGNKASLIARIQQEDKRATLNAVGQQQPQSSPNVPIGSRSVSSTPNLQAEVRSAPVTHDLLSIRLPDISQSPPEAPVQIPFVPDFWDSPKVKAAEAKAAAAALASETTPKIIVAADVSTHPLGGPVHNLYHDALGESSPSDSSPSSSHTTTQSKGEEKGGLFADVCEDLNLPLPLMRQALSSSNALFRGNTRRSEESDVDGNSSSEKSLGGEERKGLWALLGIVIGSWAVSRIVAPSPPSGEEAHTNIETH